MQATAWNILERLPSDLLGSMVLSNLELRDFVNLDFAVGTKGNERNRLLQAAFPFSAPLRFIEVREEQTSKMAWLQKRLITGFIFSVSCSLISIELFGKYASTIASISVNTKFDHDQSVAANIARDEIMAPLIKRLIFQSEIQWRELHDLPNQVEHLEHLEWIYSVEAEPWCVQLLQHNPCMKKIRIEQICPKLGEQLAGAIVRSTQLQELTVGFGGIWSGSLDQELAAIANTTVSIDATLPLKRLGVTNSAARGVIWLGEGLTQLLQRCPLLQELNLCGVLLREEDAVSVVKACPCLQSLVHEEFLVTNAVLEALVEVNPPLHTVNLCWAVTSMDAVQRATPLLSRLRKVELAIHERTYKGVPFCVGLLSATLELMTRVWDLALTGSLETLRLLVAAATATAGGIGNKLHELVLLNLPSDEEIINSLHQIALCCPHMRELSVEGDVVIEDAFLVELAAHCPGLQSLTLRAQEVITDVGIVALAAGCAHLQKLSLCRVCPLTDASVLALAKGCPKLREFNCRSFSFTEPALVQLIHSCRHLLLVSVMPTIMTAATAAVMHQQRAGLHISRRFW